MASAVVRSDPPSASVKYDVFCQLWHQYDASGGDTRKVGVEVELIGSHTNDINHIDPACPMCSRLRSLLLVVAQRVIRNITSDSRPMTCQTDSHANSILCLPARGNRGFVSVSLNIFWGDQTCAKVEADLLRDVKECLDTLGIRST